MRKLAFKYLAISTTTSWIIAGLTGIYLAYMGFGVWSLVIMQLIKAVIETLILWITSDWCPAFNITIESFKEMCGFITNLIGIEMINFLNRYTADLLIGYYLGPTALGYYNIAYRLCFQMIDLLVLTFNSIAMPVFSRLQTDFDQLRNALYNTIQVTTIIAFPIFFGLFAVAPDLVVIIFGKQWEPSIPVIRVLSFIGILYSLLYYNATIIIAVGKPFYRLILQIIQSIGNIVGFLIAVRWGIVAVSISFVVAGYLLSPLSYYAVKKLIGINIRIYFKKCFPSVIGSAIMLTATIIVKQTLNNFLSQLLLFFCSVFTGALIYFLVIWILFPKLVHRTLEYTKEIISGVKR